MQKRLKGALLIISIIFTILINIKGMLLQEPDTLLRTCDLKEKIYDI